MKNIFYTLTMLVFGFIMSGCLDSVDDTGFEPKKPQISFSEQSLDIDQNGGELKVNLNTNLPWRLKSDAAWLSISQNTGLESGELVINVTKNRTRKERVATITAWIIADEPIVMTITQAPAPANESFTYYVKTDGDGLAEGFTWETATTLSTAIERAADGDKICVAAGAYTPMTLISGGESENERTFEIHSNFTIEGGYPADAAAGAVPDPSKHETIFDGGSTSYHVVVVSALKGDTPAVLKNITITGGKSYDVHEKLTRIAGETLVDMGIGGGIYIGKSNFVMENCRIQNNYAYLAGGCYIASGAEVVARKCIFQSNTSEMNAGAIWNSGGTLYMYDSTVAQNIAGAQAGGYYSIDGESGRSMSISRIYNCAFYGNDNTKTLLKRSGGALYIRAGSDAVFVNCSITGNKAGWGGAISGHGTSALPSKTTFFNCTITGNHANDGGGGLFVYNAGATINAYNCIVSGNTTSGYAAESGPLDGVPPTQIKVANSILGSSLVDEFGSPSGGWTFSPESMLGEFGLYNGGFSQCFPLIESSANPAVDEGLSNDSLRELAAGFSPAVEMELLVRDQNGLARTKKSIGSYTTK